MKRFFIILTAAVLAAISCTREEDKINKNIDADADFVATIDDVISSDSDTKAGINGNGYVSWHMGDTISVIAENSTEEGLYVVSNIDANGRQAHFTFLSGTKPDPGAAVHAYFPASLHKKKGQACDITLPLNLSYDLNQSDRINYLPLHAYGTDKILRFKNFCALMKVTTDQSTKVEELQLIPSRQPVNGDYKIDKDGALTLVDGEISLQLKIYNAKTDASVHEFYLPIPPGIYDDIKLCVNKSVEQMCWMNFMIPQMEFEANTIYPVNGKEKYWTSSEFMKDVYKFLGQNLGYDCKGDFSPLFALNLLGSDVMAADYGDHSDLAEFSTLTYDIDNKVVCKLSDAIYAALCLTNQVINYWGNTGEEKDKQPVAEAKVIRAYLHYLLAMYFYKPYFMDHVLGKSESLKPFEGTPDELLKWCVDECDAALSNLVERKDQSDKENVLRVTKGFANALKGKCLMCAGDYAGAKTPLESVIKSNCYDIVEGSSFANLYHAEGNGCKEKIFELVCTHDEEDLALFNWKSDAFETNPLSGYVSDGVGCIGVNQTFGDSFYANDGDSYRFLASLKNIPGDNYIKEGGLKCQSFWLPVKQLSRRSDILRNFTVMRYAEVELMYAECCVRSGGDAKTYINNIQKRAGTKTVSSSADMNVVKSEYAYEMLMDGQSWINAKRWNKNDEKAFLDIMAQNRVITTLYDSRSRQPQSGESPKWMNSFYYLTTDLGTADLEKYLYLPYPKRFLESHPNMEQAPGW